MCNASLRKHWIQPWIQSVSRHSKFNKQVLIWWQKVVIYCNSKGVCLSSTWKHTVNRHVSTLLMYKLSGAGPAINQKPTYNHILHENFRYRHSYLRYVFHLRKRTKSNFRTNQWRIQDFSEEGVSTRKVDDKILFWPIFPKNNMKMNKFGPSDGALPLDPPMQTHSKKP